MAGLTQEQKDKVISEAQKYGGVDSEAFKNKVNTQYGTGAYDTLVNKAAQGVTTGQISGDLTKANQELGTNVSQEQVDLGKQISTGTFSAEQAKTTQVSTPTTPVKTETPKPTTTTDITYSEDKTAYNPNNVISKAPIFTGGDGKQYQTVRNNDNTLTTIDVSSGQAVTGKYTDAERDQIKQSFLQSSKPEVTADDIYNNLKVGVSVDKNSTGYAEAKTRYDNYSKYAGYSSKQFQTALNEGLILPGTQTYNDLIKDPKIKLELDKAQSLNIINGQKTDTTKVFETQSEEIANNTKVNIGGETMTLKQAMTDGYISQDEYNQITNNSEVVSKYKEVEGLKNKVNELQSQYDNIKSQVEEDIKNSGKRVSDSTKRALIANYQTKQLGPLNLAISNLNTANGTLTQLKTDATQMFATNLEIYQNQQAREQALQDLADQRKYQAQLTAEERKYNETQAQKELEQKYNYTYGDINSTNPQVQNIAIENAVKSMYDKYPLPGMESQSIKVQKIKDKIAQGMTGTQAIQEVENEIRNSNRYKQFLASESAKLQPKATESWTKLNDGTLYNQTTGETKSITPTTDTTQTGTTYNPYVGTADTIQADINRIGGDTNLTGQIIEDTGSKYGINPYTLASFIRNDTSYGKNMYSKNNYGNVGNTDSLVAGGKKGVEYATPQEGVEAVANNLRKRVDAYKSITGGQIPTVQELATGVTKDGKRFYGVYMTSKQGQQNVQSIFNQLNKQSPAVVLPNKSTSGVSDIISVGQLLKDNQNRGTGYSEADVTAFNDKIDRYVKNNDTDGMALAIRQNLLQDKDFKTEIDNVQKFKTGLTQVEKLISDYEKAGKSTNALKSMAEKIARKTGMTTDETLAQMQTQMGFVLADYIRSISGTAASDAEVKRLMGNMANLSNVSSLNKTILSQVKSNAQAGLESMIDTRMYGLPESFKSKAFKDIYGETTKNTGTSTATGTSTKPKNDPLGLFD